MRSPSLLAPLGAEPRPPLNKHEMAAWLKCSKRKLEKLMANKEIPYLRIGGRVGFDLEVVTQHFRQRCKISGQ